MLIVCGYFSMLWNLLQEGCTFVDEWHPEIEELVEQESVNLLGSPFSFGQPTKDKGAWDPTATEKKDTGDEEGWLYAEKWNKPWSYFPQHFLFFLSHTCWVILTRHTSQTSKTKVRRRCWKRNFEREIVS